MVLVETGSVLLLTLFASFGYVGTLIAPMFGVVVATASAIANLLAMMRTVLCGAGGDADDAGTGPGPPNPRSMSFINRDADGAWCGRPTSAWRGRAGRDPSLPHDLLIGAISVSRTTMDTARIAGALSGAGLFAALGIGPGLYGDRQPLYSGDAADALRGGAAKAASGR